MITKSRKRMDSGFRFIGRTFSFLSPNQWTLLSLLPALLTAWLILRQSFLPASLFLLLAGFFDLVDGAVARYRRMESKLGAYLDTMIDRWIEGLVILPLFLIPLPAFLLPAGFWLAAYLFGSLLTTYAKAASAEKGLKAVRGGLLERPERILCIFLALLLASFDPLWLVFLFSILSILANLTAIQRLILAIK